MTPLQKFYSAYLKYLPFKNPKNILKCNVKVSEELGEVSEAVAAITGNSGKIKQLAEEGDTPEERLAEEIMDVIITSLNLANAAKIDVDQMFLKSSTKLNLKTAERKVKKKQKPNKHFPYKGHYDAEKDEYISECKICGGEGWVCKYGETPPVEIVACTCNPEKLLPRD